MDTLREDNKNLRKDVKDVTFTIKKINKYVTSILALFDGIRKNNERITQESALTPLPFTAQAAQANYVDQIVSDDRLRLSPQQINIVLR
jgi:hypothetical protein